MSDVKLNLPDEPVFRSVSGLENLTFDGENIVSGRGATEDQLGVVWNKYLAVKADVDALENNPQDVIVQELNERMDTLETLIEQGCESFSPSESQVFQTLQDRVDALEMQIEECCNRPCFGEQGETPSGDNTITVNFEWNGVNQITAGGKATATCSNSERSIRGYWFLVRDANSGMYFRSSSANGGAFTWHIDSAGNVTSSSGGSQVPYAVAIVAVDDANNEGSVSVNLPIEINVAGG